MKYSISHMYDIIFLYLFVDIRASVTYVSRTNFSSLDRHFYVFLFQKSPTFSPFYPNYALKSHNRSANDSTVKQVWHIATFCKTFNLTHVIEGNQLLVSSMVLFGMLVLKMTIISTYWCIYLVRLRTTGNTLLPSRPEILSPKLHQTWKDTASIMSQ